MPGATGGRRVKVRVQCDAEMTTKIIELFGSQAEADALAEKEQKGQP